VTIISRVTRQSRSRAPALPLIALALTLSSQALAQGLSSASNYRGENGVKMGEGRLHPYLDLEMRYDSAAGFFDAGGGATGQLKPEMVAHFRPGLKLDVPSPTVAIALDGNVDYVWYTGLLTAGSNNLSRLQADADASAAFNQSGAVELDLGDHFTRSDRTRNAAVGVGVLSLYNEARALLPLRPGGKALEVVPNAAFAFENFKALSVVAPAGCAGDPSCDPTGVNLMNYQNLRAGLDVRWKFLPKTAITLEGRFDSRTYNAGSPSPKASLLKAEAGLAGLVTPKVATVLKVGWGKDFSSSGANTILAMAELTYLMSETSKMKLGYLRNLEPVPTFGVYTDDRAYLEARVLTNGRATLHGTAAFDNLTFHSASNRTDKTFTLDVGPEYQFLPWLIGAAGYVLGTRSSNTSGAASVNFTRHEAYVRATFIY
jgi:hypothetical protein